MLYAVSDALQPVEFLSAGILKNEDRFLHARRVMDSYELISVTQGLLHIQSGPRSYHLSPGQFVLLFPEECHFGTQPSEGALSFYWSHFRFRAGNPTVCGEQETECFFREEDHPRYILPETGDFSANSRVNVLFVQLTDLARRMGRHSRIQCGYAQSTLLLELTAECFFRRNLLLRDRDIPPAMASLMEWLQLNYDTALSVAEIGEKFGYHPSYLTALFRRYSGCTITEYINRQRIREKKNLLTSVQKSSLAEISMQVGISDEKYFMRLFKRYEGITPTAYRKAFSGGKENRA